MHLQMHQVAIHVPAIALDSIICCMYTTRINKREHIYMDFLKAQRTVGMTTNYIIHLSTLRSHLYIGKVDSTPTSQLYKHPNNSPTSTRLKIKSSKNIATNYAPFLDEIEQQI